jgi:hypothetical protein
MTALWTLAALATLVAIVALARTRALSRRLTALNQSYWDLRYEHSRLRARVDRLDPESVAEPAPAAPPPGGVSFVPLASLKAGPRKPD